MPAIQGLAWRFNAIASQYESLRPGYPNELYEDIFRYAPYIRGSNALEIGIGGGQATNHIALEEERHRLFFAEIEKNIYECGDRFTVYDTLDLQLARKE